MICKQKLSAVCCNRRQNIFIWPRK